MEKTKLYEVHQKLGGKIVPFAGFLMPIQYEGINIEHLHVRNNVGLFDVSHMGEFILKGDQSLSLLQLICSNDVSSIGDGRAQYNCLINETGGIIDDLIIYKFNDNKFMLVTNAANIKKDWNWINLHNKKFNNELSSALISYDMRTEYAELFGVKGDYQYSCHDSIKAIRHYAQLENKKLEIKNK